MPRSYAGPACRHLLALLLALACRPAETAPAPAPSPPVENAALAIRFEGLPEGVSVRENEGERLAFEVRIGESRGDAHVEVRPAGGAAVNFVEEVNLFGSRASAEEGGKFFGGNELMTQFGTAFTARALVDRGAREERRVFLFHPDGSERLTTLVLRYPPGDAESARAWMQKALELVAALRAAA